MPYTVRRVPGKPVIVMTVTDPFVPVRDVAPMFTEAAVSMNDIKGRVYRIADARSIHITINDVIAGMTEAFKIRGEVLTDPRVVSIIVGSGLLIEIAARSFQQRQRGASLCVQ